MSKGQKTLVDFGERDDSSRVYTDDELYMIFLFLYLYNTQLNPCNLVTISFKNFFKNLYKL